MPVGMFKPAMSSSLYRLFSGMRLLGIASAFGSPDRAKTLNPLRSERVPRRSQLAKIARRRGLAEEAARARGRGDRTFQLSRRRIAGFLKAALEWVVAAS